MKLIDSINNKLADMAEEMVCKTVTGFIWGETELPECLSKLLEEE